MKEFTVTSGTWRIHENNLHLLSLCCHSFHKPSCISRNKTNITDLVFPGIHSGITDSITVQFYTNDIPGIPGSDDPDSTCAAVSIDHPLFSCHCRKLHSLSVKYFCLHRIYLIKRRWRNTEGQSHKSIFDESRSVKYDIAFSKYHACLSVIDIENHRSDLRMLFTESFYKVILRWKYWRNRN